MHCDAIVLSNHMFDEKQDINKQSSNTVGFVIVVMNKYLQLEQSK